jgi:PEP-CTERM motif
MKLSSLLLAGTLVAALAFAVPAAKADSIPDPHIIMNGGGDPATCEAQICFGAEAANMDTPVVLDFFDASETFEYVGTAPLTSIFFLLEGPAIKPGVITCSGDVFAADNVCEPVFEDAGTQAQFPNSAEIFATDISLTPGEMGTLIVSPEPGTLLLLAVGLAALIGFRRKFASLVS